MNRQQLIDALAAAGFDVATITDDVPDAFLESLVQQIGGAEEPAPEEALPPEAPPEEMPPAEMPPPAEEEEPEFSEFSERQPARRNPAMLSQAEVAEIIRRQVQQQVQAELQRHGWQQRARQKIEQFCERAKTKGFPPALLDVGPDGVVPPLRRALLLADAATVHKFGEQETTCADALMEGLEALPGVVRFSELLPQPKQGGGMDPARKIELLKLSGAAGAKAAARLAQEQTK